MQTTEDQQYIIRTQVCHRMDYKPGWRFQPCDDGILITWRATSLADPSRSLSLSHHVHITDHRTDEAIVAKVFAACEYLELHEVKEWFTYKGNRLFGFGPHG